MSTPRAGDGAVGATLVRLGDQGEAVRDLQKRVTQCGHAVTLDGQFGDETLEAVRAFQTARGLRVDGICGRETWGALIESGYTLGDRLLYISSPMLRGDDVSELQRRLNALGFDAGREDGIFGPDTEVALRRFQRERGLEQPDGVCGPATIGALVTVGSLAAGSVAAVRERDALRRQARRLRDRRLFLVVDPGLNALGAATRKRLLDEGATVAIDASGDDHSVLAAQANAFAADVCIAIVAGTEPGARCAYFANQTFRSEGGMYLSGMTEQLRAVLPTVDDPAGRTYKLLRETRMAAVVCELFSREQPAGAAELTAHSPELAVALAVGIRRGIEAPIDVAP